MFVFLCTRYWHSIWYAAYTHIHMYIYIHIIMCVCIDCLDIYMYRHLSCSYLLLHVYVCDSISLSLFLYVAHLHLHLIIHSHESCQTSVSIRCALFVFQSFLCVVVLCLIHLMWSLQSPCTVFCPKRLSLLPLFILLGWYDLRSLATVFVDPI